MVVFNTGLNEFSRKYLIKNPGEDERELALSWQSAYDDCIVEMVEQLLFFKKISIKVYGENLPLTILINAFGIKTVQELVEEGVVEFVLWTPTLTTLSTDDLIGKAMPIQSGNLNSEVHCIPGESIKEGLLRLKVVPDRKVRRDLEKKLSKVYKVPRPTLVHNAAEIVMSAYTSNKLKKAGLEKNKEIQFLDKDERFKLLGLGEDILETAILAEYQYSSLGKYLYYDISHQSYNAISSATNILSSTTEIFKIEHLPDIRALLKERKLDLSEIVKLRRRSNSVKYRAWLESHADDSEYITREYINELANTKGFFETPKGKFMKIMGMYGIGAVLGGVVGGLPGAIMGTAASQILQPVSEIGLSMIDSYFLEGLLKGWTPKMFINEYEKLPRDCRNEKPIDKTPADSKVRASIMIQDSNQ